MAREQVDFREDFKLRVRLLELNPDFNPEQPVSETNIKYLIIDPRTVPFVVNLFSLEDEEKVKSSIFQATWDLTTPKNFEFDDVNTAILVIFDNKDLRPSDKGVFRVGQLQGTLWFGYPDSQMPDNTFNCGQPFDTNIDIVNIDAITTYEPIV